MRTGWLRYKEQRENESFEENGFAKTVIIIFCGYNSLRGDAYNFMNER